MLSSSTIVKGRWKIVGKIGQGAFGETYAGFDMQTSEDVAVKVERWDNKKMVLKMEVMALKKLQQCPFVVRYTHSGRQDDFNFLIMERLGDNLAELRKRSPLGTFYLSTTLKLGIQMIDAIEGVHNLGYIHRDIKPSNFVVGRTFPRTGRIFLIDFGLARKYRLPTGEIRPPRKTAGFRGTARYASINSHQLKELSRRDDLWSVFYVLVEFALGQLPWRKIKDKDQIGELKEKCTNAELVRGLPPEFLLFLEHMQSLGYSDQPDYDYLRRLLHQIYVREGFPEDLPFDWDMTEPPHPSLSTGFDPQQRELGGSSLAQEKETPGQSVQSPKNSEIEEPSHLARVTSEASGLSLSRRSTAIGSPSSSMRIHTASTRPISKSMIHRPQRPGDSQMYSIFAGRDGAHDDHQALGSATHDDQSPTHRRSSGWGSGAGAGLSMQTNTPIAVSASPRHSKEFVPSNAHLLSPAQGQTQTQPRTPSLSGGRAPSSGDVLAATSDSTPFPTSSKDQASKQESGAKKKRQGCVRCSLM